MDEITQEQVKRMQDATRKAYSRWDFFDFCEHMGFRAHHEDAHSLKMWRSFQNLVAGLTDFDVSTLTRLFNEMGKEK